MATSRSGGEPSLIAFARRIASAFPIAADQRADYGLAHRLDVPTSGAVLAAKTYRGLWRARLEFSAREVAKHYLLLCDGWLCSECPHVVEAPLRLRRRPAGRRSVYSEAVVCEEEGLPATTEVRALAHFELQGCRFTLVSARPITGRTHQIRRHLAHLGHPLVADAAYGGSHHAWSPRIFLHCHRMSMVESGGSRWRCEAPLDLDLAAALRHLPPHDEASAAASRAVLVEGLR